MSENMVTNLTNGVVTLRLMSTVENDPLVPRLVRFLSPYFWEISATQQPPDLCVELREPSAFSAEEIARCTETLRIRKSSASDFNLEVQAGVDRNGGKIAWDEQRKVGYRIRKESPYVEFYGAGNAFIHLIELVRYYGLLVEEANGTIVLHSSAVQCKESGKVIAIGGKKGAGKTTTMLSFIRQGQFVYFSGDKVLLDVNNDGNLRARGWPDFPHIGLGTLYQNLHLAKAFDVDMHPALTAATPTHHKVLIPPELFRQHIEFTHIPVAPLACLVLPEVDRDEISSPRACSMDEKDNIDLSDLIEWPHEFYTASWHGMRPAGFSSGEKAITPRLKAAFRELQWISAQGKQLDLTVFSTLCE